MMNFRLLIPLILFLTLPTARAFELESMAGANSTTYDETPEANSWGVSARFKLNFYKDNSGIFINMNCRAHNIYFCANIVGYGWRTDGDWFFEAGLGPAYGPITGLGAGFIVGTGVRITYNWFVDFPIVANIGGLSTIFWSPYIGYAF